MLLLNAGTPPGPSRAGFSDCACRFRAPYGAYIALILDQVAGSTGDTPLPANAME